jgi:hypothetical protein
LQGALYQLKRLLSSTEVADSSLGSRGLYSLLSKEEEQLMDEQHALCEKTKEIAARIGKIKMKDTRFLKDILPDEKSRSFSIVVAGKSWFA